MGATVWPTRRGHSQQSMFHRHSKLQTYATGGLSAGGVWGVRFPTHEMIKCYKLSLLGISA
jgi:hypothetical protein